MRIGSIECVIADIPPALFDERAPRPWVNGALVFNNPERSIGLNFSNQNSLGEVMILLNFDSASRSVELDTNQSISYSPDFNGPRLFDRTSPKHDHCVGGFCGIAGHTMESVHLRKGLGESF